MWYTSFWGQSRTLLLLCTRVTVAFQSAIYRGCSFRRRSFASTSIIVKPGCKKCYPVLFRFSDFPRTSLWSMLSLSLSCGCANAAASPCKLRVCPSFHFKVCTVYSCDLGFENWRSGHGTMWFDVHPPDLRKNLGARWHLLRWIMRLRRTSQLSRNSDQHVRSEAIFPWSIQYC